MGNDKKVLVVCLDAFDKDLADRLIKEGKLKTFSDLKDRSARFTLEHGDNNRARYTGLTWEHFCSGMAPETSDKWSVMSFDKNDYSVKQSFATLKPFLSGMGAKSVVFDVPYFDLEQAPDVEGIVGWGGHDTGMYLCSSPPSLISEIKERFGPLPDIASLNNMVYPDPTATQKLGDRLADSVRNRTEIIKWLLKERIKDWDVGVVAYAETHDVIELMYHGFDDNHHLAKFESRKPAKEGLEKVYEVLSECLGELQEEFPEATMVAFTMHGMGHNDTDIPTMVLLPELMHRMFHGGEVLNPKEDWVKAETPALQVGENWQEAVISAMNIPKDLSLGNLVNKVGRKIGILSEHEEENSEENISFSKENIHSKPKSFGVDWMPPHQYHRMWKNMKAFGLPAYFDGRVRINLKGREKHGKVPVSEYKALVEEIVEVLKSCRDLKTNEPVVADIVCPGLDDPLNLNETQADIKIIWNGSPIGFVHSKYGEIGPVPVRRVGGHSGGCGALYISGEGINAGDYGMSSSFDVAPTVVELSGCEKPGFMDGKSVLGQCAESIQKESIA